MRFNPQALFFLGIASLLALPAHALRNTSVAIGVMGSINSSSTGNGTTQDAPNFGGGFLQVRYLASPLLGIEGSWSAVKASQSYDTITPVAIPQFTCSTAPCALTPQPVEIPSYANEVTADWIPSMRMGHLRPFAVLGAGLLINAPRNGQVTVTLTSPQGPPVTNIFSLSATTEPVYVYGGGLDWAMLPHVGLRFQFRGNFYKAPDLSSVYASTDTYTHNAQPMIGIYFGL